MKFITAIFTATMIIFLYGCGGGSSGGESGSGIGGNTNSSNSSEGLGNNTSNGGGNNETNSSTNNSIVDEGTGWGGNTDTPLNPYENSTYAVIWNSSQGFISGPLSNADVSIFDMGNYSPSTNSGINAIFTNKTSNGTTISSTGIIPIIDTLHNNKTYVVELEGGMDMYVDNNDYLVGSVANNGKIRLVMTGFEIKNMGVKVNILTEALYQLSKDAYNPSNMSLFIEKSDKVARCLLAKDINYDGNISTLDIISWVPLINKRHLNHDYSAYYEPIVQKIHANVSIYDNILSIYRKPIFSNKTIYVRNDATINSTIGELSFVCGEEYYTNYDTNSTYFSIDNNKNIILSAVAPMLGVYPVQVNMNGSGLNAVGVINIEVINSSAPTLIGNNFTSEIPTTIIAGYNLGRAVYISSPTPITNAWLLGEGAENFNIDTNGYISVSNNANIKREDGAYNLQVFVANAYGTSAPLDISIKVYTLLELAPKLRDTNISIYGSEIAAGQIIGVMNQQISDFCEVEKFVLSNSSVFDVYTNGNIYVKATPPPQNRYDISIYAVSHCGNSSAVKLTIEKKEQILCEISTYFAKGVISSWDNTKVFIADGREGLKIIDVSNPINPYIVGSLDTYDANGIALSDDASKAYIADGRYGLRIIDISNLSNPKLISTAPTTYAQRVVLSSDGNRAYIADVTGGLTIVDISNHTNPLVMGVMDTYSVYDIAVSSDNKKAYVASGFGGIKVLDISTPSFPVLIGSLPTTYARGITISKDDTKIYIADSSGGLKIADIANPNMPSIIGHISTTNAYRIALSSNNQKAYIADGYGGLRVIDISNSTNPAITSSVIIQDARDITVSRDDTRVFVADSLGGFKIIDVIK